MLYGVLDAGQRQRAHRRHRHSRRDLRGARALWACCRTRPACTAISRARENIEYFGSLHGIGREAVCSARTAELARALGMEGFIDRRAKGFSQGQRIKVALARALVHDPANLMLDEPTNGLDVMAIRNLREMLRELRAQGRCILFSSHVMQEVAALCDRVVIIGHGRVLADGHAAGAFAQRQSGTARWRRRFSGARRGRGGRLMRALLTVFAKEFLENLRDRRTLISALLFGPLFGPILFGAMVSRMLNQSVLESDEPLHAHDLGRRARARASCAISNRRACGSRSPPVGGATRAPPCSAARRRWC